MRNEIILEKMTGYCKKILAYCAECDYDGFMSDTRLVEACVFNLSQMGELANRVDEAYSEKHPTLPWHALYGLRNRIVHDYEGVNLQLVWQIITEDLPELLVQLEVLLQS